MCVSNSITQSVIIHWNNLSFDVVANTPVLQFRKDWLFAWKIERFYKCSNISVRSEAVWPIWDSFTLNHIKTLGGRLPWLSVTQAQTRIKGFFLFIASFCPITPSHWSLSLHLIQGFVECCNLLVGPFRRIHPPNAFELKHYDTCHERRNATFSIFLRIFSQNLLNRAVMQSDGIRQCVSGPD